MDENKQLHENDLKDVAGGEGLQTGGLPCPHCGGTAEIELHILRNFKRAKCPLCGEMIEISDITRRAYRFVYEKEQEARAASRTE